MIAMSAIIAGDNCRGCGKDYYISLGHPKWYNDVVKHKRPENKIFKLYKRICRSGLCLNCFSQLGEEEIDEL